MIRGMLTPEQVESNWRRFYSLCQNVGDRTPSITKMLDELDERLCLCPASANVDYHGAFPGGLVDHSLRVLNALSTLNRAHDWHLSKHSMIISALFHDIGKVGMPGRGAENDFYIEQTDAWRRNNRGEAYAYNNALPYMTTPDRSVFVLQHYGVRLTPDEWLAIKLNDGFVVEANKAYCLRINQLVYGVMTADYHATMVEKNVPCWPVEE